MSCLVIANQSITAAVICGFPKLSSNNMDYRLTSEWLARRYVIRTAECYYGAWRCGLRQLRQLFSWPPYQPFLILTSFFFFPSQSKTPKSCCVSKRCYFRVRGFAYFLRKCSKHAVCIQLNARRVLGCDLKV